MRINIALSLAIGVGGLILAGASLPVDTQITHRTQLGDRTQPYWLVPKQSKMLKVRGGLGIVRLFGAIASSTGFGLAMHFAGEDEREQQKFWFRQSALDAVAQKTEQTFAEIDASTELNKKQMEAQAGVDLFSLRVQQNFRDAIGYIPPDYEQLALTHGKPGTLDEFTNPGDKVGDTYSVAIESNKYAYINGFVSSTCLGWGNQGGGKSWFVRYLVREKLKLGYRTIVFDPNSNQTAWEGLELYNSYPEIERMMRWYVEEVMGRYERFCASTSTEDDWRKELWEKGQAISIICEEATTYGDFIDDEKLLVKFVKVATTLSRKQEMPVTFVTHNNTQTCLGNIKGLGNLIARMQQIELIPKTETGKTQPVASGKAKTKIDGSDEWVEVEVPKIDKKITDFREFTQPHKLTEEPLDSDSEYLERAWGMEFDLGSGTSSDSPADNDPENDCPAGSESLSTPQDKVSGFDWTVRRCHEFYPAATPEQLFESVSVAAGSGESVRNIIKNVLKCGEGNDHKTRSYSRHGKALLRWLITNYDNGSTAALPEIEKFLNND